LERFRGDRRRDVELVESAAARSADNRDLLVDTGWFVERTAKEAIQLVNAI